MGALQRHAQEIRHQRHFPLHGLPEHFSARLVFPASFLVVDLGHAVARRAVQSRVTAQEPAPHPPVVQGWVERAPRTRRCRGPRRRCPRVPGSARRAASPPWLRMCSRSPRPSARGIAGPLRWPPGRTDKHPSRAWSPSRRPSCYTRMRRSTGCGWCRCRRETRPGVGWKGMCSPKSVLKLSIAISMSRVSCAAYHFWVAGLVKSTTAMPGLPVIPLPDGRAGRIRGQDEVPVLLAPEEQRRRLCDVRVNPRAELHPPRLQPASVPGRVGEVVVVELEVAPSGRISSRTSRSRTR